MARPKQAYQVLVITVDFGECPSQSFFRLPGTLGHTCQGPDGRRRLYTASTSSELYRPCTSLLTQELLIMKYVLSQKFNPLDAKKQKTRIASTNSCALG